MNKFLKVINGYMYENGSCPISDLPSFETNKLYLEDNSANVPYYKLFFYGKKHINYVCADKDKKELAVVSLEFPLDIENPNDLRALILTEQGYNRCVVSSPIWPIKTSKIKKIADLASSLKFYQVEESIFEDQLLRFETASINKVMFFISRALVVTDTTFYSRTTSLVSC